MLKFVVQTAFYYVFCLSKLLEMKCFITQMGTKRLQTLCMYSYVTFLTYWHKKMDYGTHESNN